MAIKKFYVKNPKENSLYDRKENKYFTWGYDIWLNGQRRQERGFLSQQDAKDAVQSLKQREKLDRLGVVAPSKIPYLIELFQKKLDSMEGQDRVRAKRVFKDFLSLKDLPRNLKVNDLKKAHIQLYIDKRLKDGIMRSTIRRELVPVIAALNSADDYFDVLEDYRPPKKPKLKIPKARKKVIITLDHRKQILEYLLSPRFEAEKWPQEYAARRRTGLFLQMCLLTASRPGEIAKLKRSQVDWASGVLEIVGTKTRFVKENPIRTLRITPTIAAILKERWDKAPGDFLFTRGGKVTGRMYECLKAACEATCVAYGRDTLDGITFHTARHTATTELSRSNRLDTKNIGAFTGHSDENMTLYYTQTAPEILDIAGEVLEEKMGKNLYRGEFLESNSENN